MIDRERLGHAFPTHAPRDYHDALADTLNHLPKEMDKRRVRRRALIIAAILLVLALAYAAVANKVALDSQVPQSHAIEPTGLLDALWSRIFTSS